MRKLDSLHSEIDEVLSQYTESPHHKRTLIFRAAAADHFLLGKLKRRFDARARARPKCIYESYFLGGSEVNSCSLHDAGFLWEALSIKNGTLTNNKREP